MSDAPVIGAAVTADVLGRLRNWVFDAQRDLELQDFFAPQLLDGDWRAVAERYRVLLDGHRGRVGLHGPFWSLPLDAEDPEIRLVVARRMDQALDVCAAVGADQMVVHSPFTTWDAHNLDARPGQRAKKIERVHATLAAAVRRAEDQGVTLVIENVEDGEPMERVELARSFGSPAARVSLDTGHAHYAHGVAGAPPVDLWVHAAGEILEHVHLQDADGYADRHWTIGEGTIRWRAVFEALRVSGARPRLILEVFPSDQIVESAERLVALGLGR